MTSQLPPEFRSLYRLILRTSSASVLHARPATQRIRAMWRPTFDVAAGMARKVRHPPPTQDGARTAARAQDWLNQWERQVDNTLSLLYTSAISRGLAHKLIRNLSTLSNRRKEWLRFAYERPGPSWKPSGKQVQQSKKRPSDQNESGELAWNMVGEVVRMAEGRDQLTLCHAPRRQRTTYRNLE